MDPQNPTNDQIPVQTPDLSFQVMPQDASQAKPDSGNPLPPPPSPIRASATAGSMPSSGNLNLSLPPEAGKSQFGSKKIWYIIGGAAVLLILLGVVLYFLLGSKKTTTIGSQPPAQTTPVTKLPKVWLTQYFNKDTCGDQTVCGDDADPDADGLTNYDEFKTGTSPILADTDSDGLADGDELNVYKTDPALKYTDRRVVVQQNDWTDGFQVKNGFDPLTPGIKFTDSRRQQILNGAKTYPLHEPTLTTLGVNSDGTPNPLTTSSTNSKTVSVTAENNQFNPASITVSVGDTVVWLNKQTTTIHISSTQAGLESTDLAAQQTFGYKFSAAGTFSYYDKLKPAVKGTVIVK